MSHLNFLILTLFAIFGLVTLLDRKLQHQIGHFEVCRSDHPSSFVNHDVCNFWPRLTSEVVTEVIRST